MSFIRVGQEPNGSWRFTLVNDDGIIITRSHYYTSLQRMKLDLEKFFAPYEIKGLPAEAER